MCAYSDRPRILFLTCHLPYPPVSGGRLREYELLRRIGDEFDVHVVAVSKTPETDERHASHLRAYCSSVKLFPALDPPVDRAATALPHQLRRHECAEASRHIERIVMEGGCDLFHVEGFYLMQHVPVTCPVPVLLVEQNVEYVLWRQRTTSATEADERRFYLRQYLLTLRSEIDAWMRADLCAAVTKDDRAIMQASARNLDVRVIPDGIDHLTKDARSSPVAASEAQQIVYVANFAYEPNVDGALFLGREIFPRIRARLPGARLILVGNSPSASVRELEELDRGITVTGTVPSVAPFIQAATVIACPLRIGGGIKVKMLEALSFGKAIVTTSIGAQGLAGVERAAVIADDPARFAHAVVRLLRDQNRRSALERRALRFAAGLPTWDRAADELRNCYRGLLGEEGERAAFGTGVSSRGPSLARVSSTVRK